MTYIKRPCLKFKHLKALNIFPLQQLILITLLLTAYPPVCFLHHLTGCSSETFGYRSLKTIPKQSVFRKKAHSNPTRCKIQDGTRQNVGKLKWQELLSFTVCEEVIPSKGQYTFNSPKDLNNLNSFVSYLAQRSVPGF